MKSEYEKEEEEEKEEDGTRWCLTKAGGWRVERGGVRREEVQTVRVSFSRISCLLKNFFASSLDPPMICSTPCSSHNFAFLPPPLVHLAQPSFLGSRSGSSS